jgi:hypothetical protein
MRKNVKPKVIMVIDNSILTIKLFPVGIQFEGLFHSFF